MKTKLILVSVFALAFACLSNNVSAQADKNHPRKEQVNDRLKNQNKRIDKKEANGTMSKAEGNKLKKNDHAIRQEEKDMAKQNKGHITKQEQKTLNQQENKNSKKIKKH
jgi:hypothetical protein